MRSNLIHTADPKMKHILNAIENFSNSRASVLIQGGSGTGKELLARYIHSKSERSSKSFVAINCAALPDSLLESELFGYEKGAFTGADKRKIGKFELANGSTFLLDEISEMPLSLQAKLLRVLQESEVQRLGGTYPIPINVRIIATTNRDILKMVERGEFREDLYYRLNVIPLVIPSLKQRPQDIILLSKLFVESCCVENHLSQKTLGASAHKKLLNWSWPGNIRELQNVLERSTLLCQRSVLEANDILIEGYVEVQSSDELKVGMTVSEMEKKLILKTLEHTGQNRTQAAQLLGISIRTLRNKINEYKEACQPDRRGIPSPLVELGRAYEQ